VQLTSGHWPGPLRQGQPIPVALPASTAALLHFAVGHVLTLPDSLTGARARLRVTGLYRPRDPAAPYWRLSLLGTSGRLVQGSFVTYGPMLVAASALGPGGLTAGEASWLITVDTGQIAPGGTAALGQRLGAVVTSLQTRQDLGSLQAATTLPQTLTALGSGLVVARSLLLIGSLQLILLAVAAAALAARLLATQREGENSLLYARGVARGQLAFASFAEASLLTVASVPSMPRTARTSCPEGSSSASPSPGPWPAGPSCWSPTSRPASLTWRPAGRSCACCSPWCVPRASRHWWPRTTRRSWTSPMRCSGSRTGTS
jgi:hypothetical protein